MPDYDYFVLARALAVRNAKEQHGVTVHDPYECEEEACRLCQDYFVGEKADRVYDEGKEKHEG